MDNENNNPDTNKRINAETSSNERLEDITIVDIIDVVSDRIDPLLQLFKAFFEQTMNRHKAKAVFDLRMAWIVMALIVVIVGIAGALTYLDKIDGATFTFLLGLIIGYVLTFIRDTIRPPQE